MIYRLDFAAESFREDFWKLQLKERGRDLGDIIYFTPSSRKARWLHREISKFFLEKGIKVFVPPKFFTVENFVQERTGLEPVKDEQRRLRVIRVVIEKGSLFRKGFVGAVADFIKTSKIYFPGKPPGEVLEFLSRDIEEELKKYEASLWEGSKKYFVDRLKEAVEIWKAYESSLKEEGLLDQEDLIWHYVTNFSEEDEFDTVVLDGFFDVPPLERHFFRQVLKNAKKKVIFLRDSNDSLTQDFLFWLREEFDLKESFVKARRKSSVFLGNFPRKTDEIRAIAKKIKTVVKEKKIPLHRIGVVFPSMDKYYSLVKREFEAHKIEHNLVFGSKLTSSAVFKTLLNFLDAILESYPLSRISLLFSSRFFLLYRPEVSDLIETFQRETEVKGGKEAIREGLENWENPDREKLKEYLEEFFRLALPFEQGRFRGQTLRIFNRDNLKEIYNFTKSDYAAKREFQALKRLSQLVMEMEEILPPVDLRTFRNVLLLEGERRHFWVEGDEDRGVQVMGMLEARGIDFDVLFFGGLIEKDFPPPVKKELFLSDNIKKKYDLPRQEKNYYIAEVVFNEFRFSPRFCYLSYPSMEKDEPLIQSIFLQDIEEVETWQEEGFISSWAEKQINNPLPFELPEMVYEGWKPPAQINVTDISLYDQCPFKYFMMRVMKVEMDEEITSWGTKLHRVMELSFPALRQKRRIKEAILENAEKVFNGLDKIERWRIESIAEGVEQQELSRRMRDSIPQEVEVPITFELEGFSIKAKIDRIDIAPDGYRIYDYKTSTRGDLVQMHLYALGFELSRGEPVSQLFFYLLREAHQTRLKRVSTGKKDRANYMKRIYRALEGIRKGDFSPNLSHCRSCYIKDICLLRYRG